MNFLQNKSKRRLALAALLLAPLAMGAGLLVDASLPLAATAQETPLEAQILRELALVADQIADLNVVLRISNGEKDLTQAQKRLETLRDQERQLRSRLTEVQQKELEHKKVLEFAKLKEAFPGAVELFLDQQAAPKQVGFVRLVGVQDILGKKFLKFVSTEVEEFWLIDPARIVAVRGK